jgi:D-tyrosyl-tRNA(Tyr) deacylase
MRAVVQRASQARVRVGDAVVGAIGEGLVVLLGVARGDSEADARRLAERVAQLRVFPDAAGHMNRSCLEVGGALLVVSQFTLLGDCRRGRRPGFSEAAPPEEAERLYELFVTTARELSLEVACGRFRTEMDVEIVNHGPVTLLLDSGGAF